MVLLKWSAKVRGALLAWSALLCFANGTAKMLWSGLLWSVAVRGAQLALVSLSFA